MSDLPKLIIRREEIPPEIAVKPVVGGEPQQLITLEQFREEYPLLRSAFYIANELLDRLNPDNHDVLSLIKLIS